MGVKLFLIRHGQTLWNEEGRYQGDRDIGLTRLGIRQAKLAAKYLSRINFSNIYSSPLKRAIDTANIIGRARNLKIIVRENLKEIHFGKWEGMKFNEINKQFHDDYQKWLKDPYNSCPTGGESFKLVQERAVAEIDNMINENEDKSSIAVVTHGGIILSLLVNWLQIPILRWRSIIQRQGAINIVVIDKGFPYVSVINYTGHLKPLYDEREDKVIEIYSSLRDKG
ncbi:MAG TPA: alpha-ribazole phosphatase [Candidatus Hydromicrobium sp.]